MRVQIEPGAGVGLLDKISGLFKREQSDFAGSYTAAAMPPGAPDLATFPTKKFIGTGGMHAYRLRFEVSEEHAALVLRTLASFFPLHKRELVQFGFLQNAANESIHYTLTREFGGVVVELITNSIRLMDALDQLALVPVPPWVAFPAMEPATYGSLKDPFEYWWSQLWLPFWTALDPAQRHAYLAAHQASPDWIAFFDWHTPHGA